MRAITAVALVSTLVAGVFVAVSEQTEPEYTLIGVETRFERLDEPWDYRGERAALEARKQTRVHEYQQQQLAQRRQRQQQQAQAQAQQQPQQTETQPTRRRASTQGMTRAARVIAECESGMSATAENPRSTASGLFQFLDSTWQRLKASAGYARAKFAPPHIQIRAFHELWNNGRGAFHWNASRHCWGHRL